MPRLLEICEPLKIFDITNFAYARITKDKKYFRLGTHKEYNNLFFNLDLYNHINAYRGFLHSTSFQEGKKELFFLWNPKSDPEKMRMSVNMWNGITFYNFSGQHIETYSFGSTLENTNLSDFYLHNIKLLKKFFIYFKSLGKDMIDMPSQDNRINIDFHDGKTSSLVDLKKIIEFDKNCILKCIDFQQGKENLAYL